MMERNLEFWVPPPPNNSNMILEEKLEKIQKECIGLGDFHSKMDLSRRNKDREKMIHHVTQNPDAGWRVS